LCAGKLEFGDMTRNVTIRMDEEMLRALRHRAVDEQMSLSRWIVRALRQAVEPGESREEVRQRALSRLATGYHLGGRALDREETHGR
jgi:predicted transcriptional regulator